MALALAASTPATDLETQHAVDFGFQARANLEITLHTRFRVQPRDLDRHQVRAGPILIWAVRPRLALIGGYYYYAQSDPVDRDYVKGHRFFGGVEAPLWSRGRLRFDQRALVERSAIAGPADFNRYRFRSRLMLRGAVSPYSFHEFFFDARGWRSDRNGGAIRWSPRRPVTLDFGYFYERRRADVGPERHVWFTSLNVK